jgi:hypothetical protein
MSSEAVLKPSWRGALASAVLVAGVTAVPWTGAGADPFPAFHAPAGSAHSVPAAVRAVPAGAQAVPAAAPASCPRAYTLAAFKVCVAKATAVYVATWKRDLVAAGIHVRVVPPRIVVFTSPPKNPCLDTSAGDVALASFWCGKNRTVYVDGRAGAYWTKDYAQAAYARTVLASDAEAARTTVADLRSGFPLVGATTELAHELGHWAQQVTGQMAWYDTRIASHSFAVSNGATVTAELSADCMAGWVQGRSAVDRTWVDTLVGRWAHHATMAELGGDITSVRAGFVFPREKPSTIIGYGNAYTRLRVYDLGSSAGRARKHGLAFCSRSVATYIGAPAPPHS